MFQYILYIRILHLPDVIISSNIPDRSPTLTGMNLSVAFLNIECIGVYAMVNHIDISAIFPLHTPSSNLQTKSEDVVRLLLQSPDPLPLPTLMPAFTSFIMMARNTAANNTSANNQTNWNLNVSRLMVGQVASS